MKLKKKVKLFYLDNKDLDFYESLKDPDFKFKIHKSTPVCFNFSTDYRDIVGSAVLSKKDNIIWAEIDLFDNHPEFESIENLTCSVDTTYPAAGGTFNKDQKVFAIELVGLVDVNTDKRIKTIKEQLSE
jgi:hypothetical protein